MGWERGAGDATIHRARCCGGGGGGGGGVPEADCSGAAPACLLLSAVCRSPTSLNASTLLCGRGQPVERPHKADLCTFARAHVERW